MLGFKAASGFGDRLALDFIAFGEFIRPRQGGRGDDLEARGLPVEHGCRGVGAHPRGPAGE